jgi:SAM-dependent methyltransferase
MKYLDIFLQKWRMNKAARFVLPQSSILDIGCEDGYFFTHFKHLFSYGVGIDLYLEQNKEYINYKLIKGHFPYDFNLSISFDTILMIATFEHLTLKDQIATIKLCYELLKPKGRVILTIPSPLVDTILVVLKKFGLVEARSLDEHYGFKISQLDTLFRNNDWNLYYKENFQLGLNHLFVFEKRIHE